MQLIQTVTVGSGGAANITFSSIPQTFTDLVLVVSSRSGESANNSFAGVTLNTSGGTYTSRRLQGNGSGTSSSSFNDWFFVTCGNATTSNTFGNATIYLPNYTSSNAKVGSADTVNENNNTTAYQEIWAWSSNITAAVTQVSLGVTGGFLQYSSASLYGILKGSDGVTTVT